MKAVLDFFYPQVCVACDSLCDGPLCSACQEHLEMPEPSGRCRLCFTEENLAQKGLCKACLDDPPPIGRTLAALSYAGPAIPLVHAFRKGGRFYLAKSLGSLMLLAMEPLKTPDLLVPCPMNFWSRFALGYNPSKLLAEQLGLLLDRPVKRTPLMDKRVLLVGDLLTTTSHLRHCAAALQRALPERIDAIFLCRSSM